MSSNESDNSQNIFEMTNSKDSNVLFKTNIKKGNKKETNDS